MFNGTKLKRRGIQKTVFMSAKAHDIVSATVEKTSLTYSELVSLAVESVEANIESLIRERYKLPVQRKDKIKQAIQGKFQRGDLISTRQIIETVQSQYPEIPEGSIIPSDFCANYKNKDPFSGKYHIFLKISHGKYQVI